jgi:hypothetical protein
MLKHSAITPEVIERRDYRSITKKCDMQALGFRSNQIHGPSLVIPVYNVQGEIATYQLRPDQPRMRDGKPVKYETPTGSRMALDVNPLIRQHINNPQIPLFIAEGIKKADAAVSIGLCCLGLLGVWNWRGKNDHGGLTALSDWDSIALKGRKTFIVFDSDVMTKPEVHKALVRLKAFLESRGAIVNVIYLPSGPHGGKMGLDDYIACGHNSDDLLALATPTLRAPDGQKDSDAEYISTPKGIIWNKPTSAGPVPEKLCNFAAQIDEEILQTDGVRAFRFYKIKAQLNDTEKECLIEASQFEGMRWVTEHLGVGAVISPGFGLKDRLRAAIQTLSPQPLRRTSYLHSGWIKFPDGNCGYLHAGGAVAATMPDNIMVELGAEIDKICLPQPPQGETLRLAVGASLLLLNLAPLHISYPLLSAVYRAVLGGVDFSLFIVGPSGVFKTEFAALMQQHFGAGFDARHLPGSWSSTDNYLETLLFLFKDALCVLDDFAANGSPANVQQLHNKGERVLRAGGNATGRGRMRPDGSLRPVKCPRCLPIITGEDIPSGHSLRARNLTLSISKGEIKSARLTLCQQAGRQGLFAQAMSGYIAWLAPQYERVQACLPDEIAELRDKIASHSQHRRTPTEAASLALGLRYFLEFAKQAGALTSDEAKEHWEQGLVAINKLAASQKAYIAVSDPASRYLQLLQQALSSGEAHVANYTTQGFPSDPASWGWRSVKTSTIGVFDWKPSGTCIGWVDGEDLYLSPDLAHRIAKRVGSDSGDPLVLGVTTLNKRLHDRKLLLTVDSNREVLTTRKTIGEKRPDVLHLHVDALLGDDSDQSDQDEAEEVGEEVEAEPEQQNEATPSRPTESPEMAGGLPHNLQGFNPEDAVKNVESSSAETSAETSTPHTSQQTLFPTDSTFEGFEGQFGRDSHTAYEGGEPYVNGLKPHQLKAAEGSMPQENS